MPNTDPRLSFHTLTGRVALGTFCVIPSSLVAEALASAGFDWICIDCQHGPIGFETMASMVQALDITHTPAVVRVGENSTYAISRALDAGAVGVVVPMVETPEEARRAVDAACYPPLGHRSWGPTRAAFSAAPGTMPNDGLVLVMLETASAFERAGEILAVPGVAGVFVGPSDLAVSLGLAPSEVMHAEVRRRCADVIELCRRDSLIAGIGSHSLDHAEKWIATGFQMLSIGRDLSLLRSLGEERLRALRALTGGVRTA